MATQEKDQRLVDIGQRLKDFRKKQGYKSQEAFSEILGTTRSAYKNYETGIVEPTGTFLRNLSTKFGADINYVLTGKSGQELPDLDAYLSRLGVDDMMRAIIKGYMKLSEGKRKTVRDFIENLAAEITVKKAAPSTEQLKSIKLDKSDKPEILTPDEQEFLEQYRLEKTTRTSTASRSTASA